MTRYCAVLCTSRLYCTQLHCIVHKCAVFFLPKLSCTVNHRAVVYKFVLNSKQLHKCFALRIARSHFSWCLYRALRLLCCYFNFGLSNIFWPCWWSVERQQLLLLQFFPDKLEENKYIFKAEFSLY